jgi:hypothetical protein
MRVMFAFTFTFAGLALAIAGGGECDSRFTPACSLPEANMIHVLLQLQAPDCKRQHAKRNRKHTRTQPRLRFYARRTYVALQTNQTKAAQEET